MAGSQWSRTGPAPATDFEASLNVRSQWSWHYSQSIWHSTDSGLAADDPWTLSNCLPLVKAVYKQALPKINELQRRIIDSKQTHIVVQQADAPVPTAQPSMAKEIQKLADMHAQGILDSDEFKAAKQAVIVRHT